MCRARWAFWLCLWTKEEGGPDPYDEPEDNGEPWWMFFKYITTTQVVIALSFSLIILLMLATFNVVLHSGGISFRGRDVEGKEMDLEGLNPPGIPP